MGAVEVDDQVDTAPLGVGAHERQHLGGNPVEVARQELGLVLSEQAPHSAHDLARPQIVLANGLEDLAQLVEARGSGIEQHLGGVGIAQDGSERLVDLVGDGRGELSRDREGRGMRERRALALQIALGVAARGALQQKARDEERLEDDQGSCRP